MAFVVELKNAKGHTIYDTSLRNFSLISRQRVTVPPPQNGGVEITIPNPETTIPFVRIEGNYESNVCLIGGVVGNKLSLTLAPPASGSASVTSKIAIIYFMGVGTTGIVPEYGAVIRSASGAVEWSSLDVCAGAYARLRRSDNTSGSLMRLSDSNGYCQARIVRGKSKMAMRMILRVRVGQ